MSLKTSDETARASSNGQRGGKRYARFFDNKRVQIYSHSIFKFQSMHITASKKADSYVSLLTWGNHTSIAPANGAERRATPSEGPNATRDAPALAVVRALEINRGPRQRARASTLAACNAHRPRPPACHGTIPEYLPQVVRNTFTEPPVPNRLPRRKASALEDTHSEMFVT